MASDFPDEPVPTRFDLEVRPFWVILINLLAGNAAVYAIIEYGYRQHGSLVETMLGYSFFLTLLLIYVLRKFREKVKRLEVMKWALLVAILAPLLTFFSTKVLNGAEPVTYVTDILTLKFLQFYLVKYLVPPLFVFNLVLLRWVNQDESSRSLP